jgi:flagellar hook protein FlgE
MDEQSLESAQDGLYRLKDTSDVSYGYAGSGRLGNIQSESLESANVDLVREFAEMIIAQRGYQASSQVLNISNQLVDTLYNSTQS